MNVLRAIGKMLFSRVTLGLVLLLVIGVGIWFGGPHLGIGETRPLEDSGVRIMVLVLIVSFVLFWLAHWPVSVVGVAALCLLIWYGSPLLVFGETRPFAPEMVRIGIVSVLGLLFAAFLGYRIWGAFQANNALLRKILHPAGGDSPAKEQINELHHIVRKALLHLRTISAGVSGVRRVFQHSRYIYELPWYMVFGAPGTGKTTLILNSGLKFPLAEQGGDVSLAGVKGTKNCVWWFTDEAVLIDTAGRYTTHETNEAVDAAEWKGFLGLLRKYRPRAPLNGAVLAISVEELGRTPVEINRLAASLRERLSDLQTELGVSFPIYILITKMDLVRGFQSFFQNLGSEGRNQVFGFTLPYAQGVRQSLANLRQICEGEIALLKNRLDQGLNSRLHEAFVPDLRRELYFLPGDFGELSAPLMQLIDGIFFESRYDAANLRHILRGVYFTSAIQEDAALPLNRGSLLRRLQDAVKGESGLPGFGRGNGVREIVASRSYFLEDTLRKVIFPEAFLVRRNTRWELKFMLVRGLGHLVAFLAAIGLGLAVLHSAENNTQLLDAIAGRTATVTENLRAVAEDGRDRSVAQVLAQACSLTQFPDIDTDSPPFSYRVGLYAASDVNAAAETLCVQLRERFLLPPFADVIESHLRRTIEQATRQRDSEHYLQLYDVLHFYTSFYDPTRYDASALMGWFTELLAGTSGENIFRANEALLPELQLALERAGVNGHTLLKRPELIAEARKHLQTLSRERRLYLLITQALTPEAPEPFVPLRYTGESGALYRADGVSLAAGIPGLFTYAGYHEIFDPRLNDLMSQTLEQDILLMTDKPASAESFMGNRVELARLNREIRKLYYQEYTKHWSALLETLHAGSGASPEQDLILLTQLGGANSPLDQLARAVVLETALSAKETTVTDQLATRAEKRLRSRTRTTGLDFGGVDETALVDARFEGLRKVVTGSTAPASVRSEGVKSSAEMDEIRLLLTEYALYTRDLQKAAQTRAMPPESDITERLKNKAMQLPPFFSTVLLDLADRGARREGESKGATLTTLLEPMTVACTRLVGSRYPFVSSGRDADPVELARVFGPSGLIESYFIKNLAAIVDTATRPWVYIKEFPGAPDLEPFEKAAALRDALYGAGGEKQWSIKLRVSVVDMDPRIERLELTIADKVLRYAHGPDDPLEVIWEGGNPKNEAVMLFWPRNAGLRPVRESGTWALFRLLDRGKVVNRVSAEEFWVEYDLDGASLTLSITTPGETPLGSDLFQETVCPGEVRGVEPIGETP